MNRATSLLSLSLFLVSGLAACDGKVSTLPTEDSGTGFDPDDGGSDGTDGTDGTDGSDGTDGTDGGTDGSDGGTDGTDGGTDGSDGGTDGGGTSGGGEDLDGVYTGTFEGYFATTDGSLADNCSGPITVDVNSASAIDILSNATCTWVGLMALIEPTSSLTFEGNLYDGGSVGGEVNIPVMSATLNATWSGVVGGGSIDGSYSGSGDIGLGMIVDFGGSFRATK